VDVVAGADFGQAKKYPPVRVERAFGFEVAVPVVLFFFCA
jgi:hypothetical protein